MHDFLPSQVSIAVNCGCIVVAIIGALLISVDLARWNPQNDPFMRVRITTKTDSNTFISRSSHKYFHCDNIVY